MARFYLSSTYADLVEFRSETYRTLRRMGHDVVAMEDYVASDQRPSEKCLADVEACDVYVGVVGWRYGFVPARPESARDSITKLEYLHASKCGKPRLLFLLSPATPWPVHFRDEGNAAESLREFRASLERSHVVSFFETPTQLALLVSIAVRRWEIESGITRPIPALEDQAFPAELDIKNYVPGKSITVALPLSQMIGAVLFAALIALFITGLLFLSIFEPDRVEGPTAFLIPFSAAIVWLALRPGRMTFDLEKRWVKIQGPGAISKGRPVSDGLELLLEEGRRGWTAALRYNGLKFGTTAPFQSREDARNRFFGFATALNYALGMHTLNEH